MRTTVLAKIRKTLASATLVAVAGLPMAPMAQAVTPTVALVTPAAGTSVSGTFSFEAMTDQAVSEVRFNIVPTGGTAVVCPATAGTTGTNWTCRWDSTTSQNGSYTVQASAYVEGVRVSTNDEVRPFYVYNQTLTNATVSLTSPASGTSFTAMPITFSATASGPAGFLVRFRVQPQGASSTEPPIAEITGALSGNYWTAHWNETSRPAGNYQVTAVVTDAVNTQLAADGPRPFSYNPPNNISVSLVTPTAGLNLTAMPIALSATTSVSAYAVDFRIFQPNGMTPLYSFPGMSISGSQGMSWSGTWNSSGVAGGAYEAQAVVIGQNQAVIKEGSRVSFQYSPTPQVSISLGAPAAASVFTAAPIGFTANTTGTGVSQVVFKVWTPGQPVTAAPVAEVTGTMGGNVWTANWTPAAGYNGGFEVRAFAMSSTSVVLAQTEPRGFQYTPSSTASVSIVTPTSGLNLTAMPIALTASTTDTVAAVSFRIYLPGGSTPLVTVDGTTVSASQGKSWQASWNSSTAAAGSYEAQAVTKTSAGGAIVSESSRVGFNYAPSSTVVAAMTAPAASTVYTASPVSLSANTTGTGVNKVVFKVWTQGQPTTAAPITEVTGSGSANAWSGSWSPASGISGWFDVRAYALSSSSAVLAISEPRSFKFSPSTSTATVTMTLPTAGQTLTAMPLMLSANSSGAEVTQTAFRIRRSGASAATEIIVTARDAATGGWSASWNSADAVAGAYEASVVAKNSANAVMAESAWVGFNYAPPGNQAVTVVIGAPAVNATISSATMPMSATVTGTGVSQVKFRIFPPGVPPTGTPFAEIPGTVAATAANTWTANWTPPTGTTGLFDLYVYALDSASVRLNSEGPRTFNFAPGQTTTVTVQILAPANDVVLRVSPVNLSATASGSGLSRLLFRVYPRGASATATPLFSVNGTKTNSTWSASWTPSITTAADLDLTVEAYDANNNRLAAAGPRPFRYETTSTPPPNAPVVTMPLSGAILRQSASLSATVSRKADEVVFAITGSANAQPLTRPAMSDAAGLVWNAVWDTLAAANGQYQVKARARFGTDWVESELIGVYVTNEAASPPTALKVTLGAPGNGATLSGSVVFRAEVEGQPGSVQFILEPVATASSAPFVTPAIPGTDGVWSATVDTAHMPNGAYRVRAKAMVNGQFAGESASVDVKIDNLVSTPPTTEIPSTAPPTGTPEAPLPPLAAKVVGLPYTIKGVALLAAEVTGGPESVTFLIKATDGSFQQDKPAIFAPESRRWVGLWDTTVSADGRYGVVVMAVSGSRRASSLPVYTLVANQLPPTQEKPGTVIPPVPPPVPLSTVVVLPPEAIRAAAQETPTGTKPFETAPLSAQITDAVSRLDAECVKNNIPANRCDEWLAFRSRNDKCRQAGIITKEECVAYLGQVSRDLTPDQVAQQTVGLLSATKLNELQTAVTPLVGTVIKFQRPEKPAEPEPGETPAAPPTEMPPEKPTAATTATILAENIPLQSNKETTFKVQASPALVRTDATTNHEAVPAVLMIDSDGDGLPDDVEKRWGADPLKSDTDGDGYSDSDEVKNGYNPLGPGKLGESLIKVTPVDAAIVSGVPMEQPRVAGEESADMAVESANVTPAEGEAPPQTTFQGKARPGETVTIFIYSYLPLVLTTTADESGNWEYELADSLTDGEHTAYVAVTDDTGKIQAKSAPLSFFVAEAQAVSEQDYFKPVSVVAVEEPMNQMMRWYVIGAIALVVVALGIGLAIVLRRGQASV
ncbi:MAG: Ig-like domain-containing protein [Patescibacteria group bacterium]|nr:Ig-like domain-containing protein [Patescibacteria group bacterium]